MGAGESEGCIRAPTSGNGVAPGPGRAKAARVGVSFWRAPRPMLDVGPLVTRTPGGNGKGRQSPLRAARVERDRKPHPRRSRMVEISLSGSGEGPGGAIPRGYSTSGVLGGAARTGGREGQRAELGAAVEGGASGLDACSGRARGEGSHARYVWKRSRWSSDRSACASAVRRKSTLLRQYGGPRAVDSGGGSVGSPRWRRIRRMLAGSWTTACKRSLHSRS